MISTIVWLSFMFLGFLSHIVYHDKPMKMKYNVFAKTVVIALQLFLLYHMGVFNNFK